MEAVDNSMDEVTVKMATPIQFLSIPVGLDDCLIETVPMLATNEHPTQISWSLGSFCSGRGGMAIKQLTKPRALDCADW
jgi:hypothetical protein